MSELGADFIGRIYRVKSGSGAAAQDSYGIVMVPTNPAEFFAVVTETFFEKPKQLAKRHPELFTELQKFYRVDPRAWQ